MGCNKFSLKLLFRPVKIDCRKKTTPSINIPFSSKVGTITISNYDQFLNTSNYTVFVPTYDTKVTEYLCSEWVFFRQISTF